MKTEKGITLMSVSIYIVVVLIVLGMLATIMASMQSNVKKAGKDGIQIAEINKFEMYFLQEVKKQGNQVKETTNNNTQIEFTSGNIYKLENNEIKFKQKEVEGEITIAEAINSCTFIKSTDENGREKIVVEIQPINMNEPITKEYILNEAEITYNYENENDYVY